MFIADFHVHSRFSRATSKDCVPEFLELWARRKGLGLVGTGDFTHPAWRTELRDKMTPLGDGLYTLRPEFRKDAGVAGDGNQPRFIVSGEISSIYKKGGRVRKVHNVILLPGLEAAEVLSKRLEAVGNLHSDGRPILGLDSRDLMQIALDICPDAMFIPAHIWTPHFSLFGAYSGFDAIEECFEDLTDHICALETGLSSDPAMNRRLSALDRFALISNSDAHSPGNLAREANLFDCELSYRGVARALRTREGFLGTIEFFPEEGKYHLDGHRACGVCLRPEQTRAVGGICPTCGGRITVGVLSRVEALADRPEGFSLPGAAPYESVVPLMEMVSASMGVGVASARATEKYLRLIGALGPELYILRVASLSDIRREAGELVAEGIARLRAGLVDISPGYDGEYGKISVMDRNERNRIAGQTSFLSNAESPSARSIGARAANETGALTETCKRMGVDLSGTHPVPQAMPISPEPTGALPYGLNAAQWEAVSAEDTAIAVVAGPGTGKTHTLVARVACLIERGGAKPSGITAVTFTNKAAGEMRERLRRQLGPQGAVNQMTIGTFHSICLRILSGQTGGQVAVADEADSIAAIAEVLEELGLRRAPRDALREISRIKNGFPPAVGSARLPDEMMPLYDERLSRLGVMDYDDILLRVLSLYEHAYLDNERGLWDGFSHLLVDEFQDINPIQYRLIGQWSRGGAHVFVIGDPDQAIYGFRGADARCFEHFLADRADARRVELAKNYRSTPEILHSARSVLAGRSAAGALEAVRGSGTRVRVVEAENEYAEAAFVAQEIGRMVGGMDMLEAHAAGAKRGASSKRALAVRARGFSDIAVLYRTNRQAEALTECLRRQDIPHTVAGRDAFLSEPIVRRAVAFFRLLLNPSDRGALRACLLGVGVDRPRMRGIPECGACPVPQANDYPKELTARIEMFSPLIRCEKPRKLIEMWGREEQVATAGGMERLLNTAILYDDMEALVHDFTLGGEGDLKRSGRSKYASDSVSLATIHASKGLEFPVVFLCGATEEYLPLRDRGGNVDPDEERRILYVGMTRAKDELILMTSADPSPFLLGLPSEAMTPEVLPKRLPEVKQIGFFDL